MSSDPRTYKTATVAALVGFCIQLLVTAAMVVTYVWMNSQGMLGWPMASAAMATGIGLLVWITLSLYMNERRLEMTESLEIDAMDDQQAQDQSIFELGDDIIRVHRKRLLLMKKWLLPITSIVLALLFMGVGGFDLSQNISWLTLEPAQEAETANAWSNNPLAPQLIGLMGVIFAIFSVLAGRYMAVMGKRDHWVLLRSGAGYMMGLGLIMIGLAIVMAAAWAGNLVLVRWFGVIVPIGMIVLGLEIALSFVLEVYRPRQAGEFARPAFDSRLLSLLSMPESIAKTINEAINYQFGFEITGTWFWQLLARLFLPLVGFGGGMLLLLSCIYVVQPNEKVAVYSFGAINKVSGPGIHFKLPWPMQTVKRVNVDELRVVTLGVYDSKHRSWMENEDAEGKDTSQMQLIWDDVPVRHSELYMSQRKDELLPIEDETNNAGLALIAVEVELQYRVSDLQMYLTGYENPDEVIKALGQQVLTEMLLDYEFKSLLSEDRVKFTDTYASRLRTAVQQRPLGIEVVWTGLNGSMPHTTLVQNFRDVVTSKIDKRRKVEDAQADAIRTLTSSVGSVQEALELSDSIRNLYDKIADEQEARSEGNSEQADKLSKEIELDTQKLRERLRTSTSGQVAKKISEAEQYQQEVVTRERVRSEQFNSMIKAYEAAPAYFVERRRLDVISASLSDLNKYVLLGEWAKLKLRLRFDEESSGLTPGGIQSGLNRAIDGSSR